MILKNERELANTREKLADMEARYEELRSDSTTSPHVRELTLHSLKRVINQMKEEIVLYRIKHPETSAAARG